MTVSLRDLSPKRKKSRKKSLLNSPKGKKSPSLMKRTKDKEEIRKSKPINPNQIETPTTLKETLRSKNRMLNSKVRD